MASRAKHSSRPHHESDSLEALKPAVVLVLFGTILYGAYSVVQKGSAPTAERESAGDAPAFTPPAAQLAQQPAATQPGGLAAPQQPVVPAATPVAAPPPAAVAVAPPIQPPTPPVVAAASLPPAAPATSPSPAAALPTPPPSGEAAGGTPTYLAAQSAAPPTGDLVAPVAAAARPDRYATLSPAPPPLPRTSPAAGEAAPAAPAAFATAWADAHDKLAGGRYAEALAALSVWYDDPSLGLEESQRLEDLLGQLAGTVVYSQQDLLLPPHVVAPGDTLATIAAPLGVSPRLLAKINGISDPQQLVPGEHLKLVRGPFDAVVSVSRRRLSLQLGGSYAGSFPAVVGRQFMARVGTAISVVGPRAAADGSRPAILLGDGLVIESAEDPGVASDNAPDTSLLVSVRDLQELLDILGPGSRVLVRH